jgi:asparagine synthase (glutamine-hydrolysing)
MSGVGGDELFAGYSIFKQFLQLQKLQFLIKCNNGVTRAFEHVLSSNNKLSWQLKRLLQLNSANISDVYPMFRQILSRSDIGRLTKLNFDKRFSGQLQSILKEQLLSIQAYSPLSQVSIADYLGYTQQVLLKDTDQMSMASSLEVREPFFDHDLVEYVLNVPDKFKLGKYPKSLLVDATNPILPDEIVQRKKQGFVLPYDNWIRNELHTFCKQKIDSLSNRPIFDYDAVQKFWQKYLNRQANIRWADIWILVVLENWLQKNNVE